MDALITVEGVEKDFGNEVKALDQINLEIASVDTALKSICYYLLKLFAVSSI